MITIIDYNAGNLASVKYALNRLGFEYEITNDKEKVKEAKKIIFPGVGHAKDAMDNLFKLDLVEILQNIKVPFLGICLGMQIMFDMSEEGSVGCLGILPGKIKKFQNLDISKNNKIPHMGWNNIEIVRESVLFKGIANNSYFYFVHSYYASIDNYTLVKTNYINDFSVAFNYKNFYGVQFHPEKSGDIGEKILENFVKEI